MPTPERAELYGAAGADMIFVEAPESQDELAEIGRRIDGPLLVNIVKGGAPPQLPAQELGALGFDIVLNFRITVPHDAVYDRSPTFHAVNLFDMAQKYADVTTTADVIGALPDAPR
jgi:hypothetical protein